MRKILVLATLGVAGLTAYPAIAGATHAAGTSPKYEKTDGTGQSESYGKIHVNAKDPGTPQGHFTIGEDPDQAEGQVTCLNVDGNRAVLGGVVTEPNGEYPEGSTVLIGIEDNGSPGADDDPDRHFRSPPMPPGGDQQCNNPITESGFSVAEPITRGNYLVHDFAG